MKEMTLKHFIETTDFSNGRQEFGDIMFSDTEIPDGWIEVGCGGHIGDYGDGGFGHCWATSDHRVIIFYSYEIEAGYDEEKWAEVIVLVAP